MVFGPLLSYGRQRVGAFSKRQRVEKMPLNIRIQWNAGTAGVSERVLKTLACRGLRVSPPKIRMACRKFRNFPVTPTPNTFSKVLPYKWEVYCRTNGRRTEVEMGGVLLGFPFFKALKPERSSDTNGERTAVQIGGVLPYFLLRDE